MMDRRSKCALRARKFVQIQRRERRKARNGFDAYMEIEGALSSRGWEAITRTKGGRREQVFSNRRPADERGNGDGEERILGAGTRGGDGAARRTEGGRRRWSNRRRRLPADGTTIPTSGATGKKVNEIISMRNAYRGGTSSGPTSM